MKNLTPEIIRQAQARLLPPGRFDVTLQEMGQLDEWEFTCWALSSFASEDALNEYEDILRSIHPDLEEGRLLMSGKDSDEVYPSECMSIRFMFLEFLALEMEDQA